MKKELIETQAFYDNLQNTMHLLGCVFYIYAFLDVLYWFLNIYNLTFLKSIDFLFLPTYNFVGLFYKQPDFAKNDLRGIVVCIIFITLGVIAQTLTDKVKRQGENAILELQKKYIEEDKQQQAAIQEEYIRAMKKYNKFVVLVDLDIQQVKSYLFDNKMDLDELRGIKISIMSELFNNIRQPYIQRKIRYNNDSFYIIGSIEHTAECIKLIIKTIKEMSRKYSHLNITLAHDLSFDAISDDIKDMNSELELLEKIIQLSYVNVSLTTSRFKTCYEIISNSTLKCSVIGKFQFKINGEPTNCELYSVKF